MPPTLLFLESISFLIALVFLSWFKKLFLLKNAFVYLCLSSAKGSKILKEKMTCYRAIVVYTLE